MKYKLNLEIECLLVFNIGRENDEIHELHIY